MNRPQVVKDCRLICTRFLLGAVVLNGLAARSVADLKEGDTAPDFQIECLPPGIDGRLQASFETIGERWLLLHFWATWSHGAHHSREHLNRIRAAFAEEELAMIAVSAESFKTVAAYSNRFPRTYPIALDTSGDVISEFGIQGLPLSILITPARKVRWIGYANFFPVSSLASIIRNKKEPKYRFHFPSTAAAGKAELSGGMALSIQPRRQRLEHANVGYSPKAGSFKECTIKGATIETLIEFVHQVSNKRIAIDAGVPLHQFDIQFLRDHGVAENAHILLDAFCRNADLVVTKVSEERDVWRLICDAERLSGLAVEKFSAKLVIQKKAFNDVSVQRLARQLENKFNTLIVTDTRDPRTFSVEVESCKDFSACRAHLSAKYGIDFVDERRLVEIYRVSLASTSGIPANASPNLDSKSK